MMFACCWRDSSFCWEMPYCSYLKLARCWGCNHREAILSRLCTPDISMLRNAAWITLSSAPKIPMNWKTKCFNVSVLLLFVYIQLLLTVYDVLSGHRRRQHNFNCIHIISEQNYVLSILMLISDGGVHPVVGEWALPLLRQILWLV